MLLGSLSKPMAAALSSVEFGKGHLRKCANGIE